jgi:alpha-mannosidase
VQAADVAADSAKPAERSPEWPSLEEVIVVCKTHFDIGYTHRVKEIVQHYRTGMIDKAMNIMERGKDLPPEQQVASTGPGWVMSKVLDDWQGQTPDRRKRLDDYVRAGRFKFHALPFTLESDACEPEEMARGLVFSSNLCRRYGLPLSISGKMTDVPSHGGALETVLANGGVTFMHIGCNWPSGYVRTPGLFWWQGPDGSRTLTLYSPIYGSCTGLWPRAWASPVTFKDEPCIGDNLLPPKGWPYKVWPAIIVTPDNSGKPQQVPSSKLSFDLPSYAPASFLLQ